MTKKSFIKNANTWNVKLYSILIILISLLFSYCNTDITQCGRTVFTETELNNSCGGSGFAPDTPCNVSDTTTNGNYDNLGLTLAPGCKYAITGTNDPAGYDYFKINTGDSDAIRIQVTWTTSLDELDVYLVDGFNVVLTDKSGISAQDISSGDRAIINCSFAVKNKDRYIVIEDFLGNAVTYTINIEAY